MVIKMEYLETEINGEYTRIGWAGGATVNIFTPIGGEWVETDCCTNYDIETLYDALETATDYLTEV